MVIQKSEAIVLKTYPCRETSLIVNFFTKDFGKISGLIKGVRSNPQRYGGLPLVFAQHLVIFYDTPKKELYLISQCDAQEQFLPIRASLEKTNYAAYLIELLDAVTFARDKNEGLFELMLVSLKALCADFSTKKIARIFEIRLLNLSGFKPHLDACVHCQKEIVAQGRFSPILGGILCPQCYAFDRNARAVLKGTLASLGYIEKATWQKALQLEMTAHIEQELSAILNNFLEVHLDRKIKSRKFLI